MASASISSKAYWIRLFWFFIGSLLIGIGIGFFTLGDLGGDPLTVLELGLVTQTGIRMSYINLFVNGTMLVIGWLLDGKNVTLATFLSMIGVSIGIDMFFMVPLPFQTGILQYVYLFAGIFVYALGLVMGQVQKCGYTPYDCVNFGVMRWTHCSYFTAKLVVDLIYLAIGILLKGTFGIGTILIWLLVGKGCEWMTKLYSGWKKSHQ